MRSSRNASLASAADTGSAATCSATNAPISPACSPGNATSLPASPCLFAFARERVFPASVRGPVLYLAFSLLAKLRAL